MSDTASFNVAIAAAVLAAGAFIIVTLQATLEYLSSGPRHKCTAAAIGITSKQVKIRWSWSNWRLKVKYPLLNLDWVAILQLAQDDDINNNENMDSIRKGHQGWFWRPLEIDDKIGQATVSDELNILCGAFREHSDGEEQTVVKAITFKHLSLPEKFMFLSYRFRHFLRPLERPRASWAQMLVALGVRDTKKLRLRMVDADTVSSALDAPIQRVKLRSLGYLAHILGFTKVTIDVTERRFTALCPWGTISTIEVSNIGKVLRFEGDILAIHALVSRTSIVETYRAAFMVNGKPSFGKYVANGLYLPLETLVQAMKEDWTASRWDREMRKIIVQNDRKFFVGPVAREARIMNIITRKSLQSRGSKQMMDERSKPVLDSNQAKTIRDEYGHKDSDDWSKLVMNTITAKWQDVTKLTIPTIYVCATFVTFHSVVSGFPSSILIQPFLPWIQNRARRLYERKGQAFYCSPTLAYAIAEQKLTFARARSDYLMSTGGGSIGGLFGWGILSMKDIFEKCPESIQSEICTDLDSRDAQAVLTSETCHLLKHFDVQGWASSVTETQREAVISFKPINLLWIQINLLDIAIQVLIRGKWSDGTVPQTSNHSPDVSSSAQNQPTASASTTENNSVNKNAEVKPDTQFTIEQTQTQHVPPSTTISVPVSSSTDPVMTGSADLTREVTPHPVLEQIPSNRRVTGVTFSEPRNGSEQKSDTPTVQKTELHQGQQPEKTRDIPTDHPPIIAKAQPLAIATSTLSPKPIDIALINSPHPDLSRHPTADGSLPKLERKPTIIPDDLTNDEAREETILVERYGSVEVNVVAAIVKSWRKQSSPSTPASPVEPTTIADDDNDEDIDLDPKGSTAETKDWRLEEALRSYSGLTFGIDDEQVRKQKFQRLADLLELRALFMIALFVLHPDSSDTYSIEGEDIEMPMA